MAPPATLLRVARRNLAATRQLPIHDFLAPALFYPSVSSRRLVSSTTTRRAEVADTTQTASTRPPPPPSPARPQNDGPTNNSGNVNKGKRKPLTKEQRDFLSSALRVNQAGELAATLIYTAQTPTVVRRQPHLRPLMRHMYEQEVGHLETFNALLARHRVRPTAMYPAWSAMSYGLGWATALMGQEAAMACTEAVETEIGDHYNGQVRELLAMVRGWEDEGYDVGAEFRGLVATLRRIRDEELEHLDHAVEHDAQKAEPHWLLTGAIRMGCRGAIWVSERV
ncbi:ubiquinone biosynthesis monooxygenase Coq7 [Diaporthe australafricana]|uniref:5-demethoxyubiquinone hydroxylase, mitochondrial n=1 Tax=Diaporthe australafricana TaxID=127596 RepID=A0ABR3WQ68_9PEZI